MAAVSIWLVTASLVVACGDDEGEVPSPSDSELDAGVRDLPGRVTTSEFRPDASIDSGLVDDLFAEYDAGPCCAVDFALAAEAGEVYAVLRGTDTPLDDPAGIPLSYALGAWNATVCMPADYTGFYYYEVYSVSDAEWEAGAERASEVIPLEALEAAGLFRTVRHNDAALTERDPVLGVVNLFPASDACGGTDAGLHSTVSGASADDDAGI